MASSSHTSLNGRQNKQDTDDHEKMQTSQSDLLQQSDQSNAYELRHLPPTNSKVKQTGVNTPAANPDNQGLEKDNGILRVVRVSLSDTQDLEQDGIPGVERDSLADSQDLKKGGIPGAERVSLADIQDLEKGGITAVERESLADTKEHWAEIDVHELVLYLRHQSLMSSDKARDILRQAESMSRFQILIQYIEEQYPSRRIALCRAIDIMYPHVSELISQKVTEKHEEEEALYVEGHFVQLAAGSPQQTEGDCTLTDAVISTPLEQDEDKEGSSPVALVAKHQCTAYVLPAIHPNLEFLYQGHTKDKHLAHFNINDIDFDKSVVLERSAILFLCSGSFPTRASHICVVDMYSRRLVVPTYAVQLYGDPSGEDWFYPASLASAQATMILTRLGLQGCFLVYRQVTNESQYTLSVCLQPLKVYHYHIRHQHGRCFWLPHGPRFNSLPNLVKYYKRNRGQLVCRLRFPPQAIDYQLDPTTRLKPHRIFDQTQVNVENDENPQVPRRAIVNGQTVILETSRATKFNPYYKEEFLDISTFLNGLEHANIARFYGLYWNLPDIGLMLENTSGLPLQEYLQGDKFGSYNTQLVVDLCSQVISVLVHLENKHFILHRDLGAHSWLMGAHTQLKVANFHLARYVYDDEYMMEPGEAIGVRWASPEILNTGKFSTKSEIWAAGVLLWQILSKGQTPYPELSNKKVIQGLIRGDTLDVSEDCPAILRSVLNLCMAADPRKRPSAGDLLVALRNMTGLYETDQELLDSIVDNLIGNAVNAEGTQYPNPCPVYNNDLPNTPMDSDKDPDYIDAEEYDALPLKLDGEIKTDKIKSGSKTDGIDKPSPTQTPAFTGLPYLTPVAASLHMEWILTGWDTRRRAGFQLQDCYSMPREFSTDYIVGDLRTCLGNNHFGKKNDALRVDLCYQIASALSYFYEKKYIIHCNLSADTCLVRGHSLLLGNFGHARFVDGENTYTRDQDEDIPIPWNAPESVLRRAYSTMSDIWSAGVVYWEIFNDGVQPYQGESRKELIHMLEKRKLRLSQPSKCPNGIYKLIEGCQDYVPASRPLASQLYGLLKKMKENQSWHTPPSNVKKAPESALENVNEEGRIAFCGVFSQKIIGTDGIVGDLQMCLENQRLNLQEPSIPLNLCLQLFSALIYMRDQKYILHRHIVPMNCLMCVSGRLRLCDGGLTRIVEKDSYQPSATAWNGYTGRVPVKWSAPETLSQRLSTTKSDVWMAAVTCCQLYNWGRNPFPGMTNLQAAEAIIRGERLTKPDLCPQHIFQIMLSCWQHKMSTRPNAKAVFQKLSKFIKPQEHVGIEVYEALP